MDGETPKPSPDKKKTLTRRGFFKVAGLGIGATLLAACAPQRATPDNRRAEAGAVSDTGNAGEGLPDSSSVAEARERFPIGEGYYDVYFGTVKVKGVNVRKEPIYDSFDTEDGYEEHVDDKFVLNNPLLILRPDPRKENAPSWWFKFIKPDGSIRYVVMNDQTDGHFTDENGKPIDRATFQEHRRLGQLTGYQQKPDGKFSGLNFNLKSLPNMTGIERTDAINLPRTMIAEQSEAGVIMGGAFSNR